MGLSYHPNRGEILLCNYPKDMRKPEMIKRRPVLVVSPKLKRRSGLVTIVPLSSSRPKYMMEYHYELNLAYPLPAPWDSNPFWAICDHPMTVSFDRLDLIRLQKDQYGKRRYYRKTIDPVDMTEIQKALTHALGLN